MEEMDEEAANRLAALLGALSASIFGFGELGNRAMLELTSREDPAVAGLAAVYAMELDPETCLPVLRRIGTLSGLIGFRARVAVERWEKGEWTPAKKPQKS